MGKDKDGEPLKKRGKNWNEADSLKLIDAFQHIMGKTKAERKTKEGTHTVACLLIVQRFGYGRYHQ
jgi:hypothetical protein